MQNLLRIVGKCTGDKDLVSTSLNAVRGPAFRRQTSGMRRISRVLKLPRFFCIPAKAKPCSGEAAVRIFVHTDPICDQPLCSSCRILVGRGLGRIDTPCQLA